mmetsp:Transcript_3933/g.5176  ORF Transcript_3933/g.5176 Transcript_3933/m.5176 type:complete len:190 (+) Transcript_3933:73-642(+)|eukprot:CAMPEP_0198144178 /NCGR_PEP_ID=MMETSP1443-20131203/13845_1 /TAXON_ID=186043 /ORGANISM="Entomoneis sp., Strain CCMP2396" /LENGTH=189 /DNA_ID=CAMNT_0043807531 /DNA_START=9 /DNA_END=578 /DNA_ORIENTATION=+
MRSLSLFPLLLNIFGLSFLCSPALAFAPSTGLQHQISSVRNRNTRIFGSNVRDDEIARLEEQLRKLKEDQEEISAKGATTAVTETSSDSFTTSSSALQQEKLFVDRQVILSEKELSSLRDEEEEKEENSTATLPLPAPLLAIAGLVFLIAFSQIPVGQEDLSKYSATGSSSVKTIDLGDLNTDVVVRPR